MNENEVKKDLYKSKAMAKFSHYVSGNLYYRVELADGTYQFPIGTIDKIPHSQPTQINSEGMIKEYQYLFDVKLSEDLGQTSFEAEIKGSDLNRWISKAIKNEEFIKVA